MKRRKRSARKSNERRNKPLPKPTKEEIEERARALGCSWIEEKWTRETQEQMFKRSKDLSSASLASAIERGLMLHYYRQYGLFLTKADYKEYDIGFCKRTGEKLMILARDPRMDRKDWEKPRSWYACYMLLEVSDNMFEVMIGNEPWQGRKFRWVSYDTTQGQIIDFKEKYLTNISKAAQRSGDETRQRPRIGEYINQVLHGDCLDIIPQIADGSIDLVVTSPPYAHHWDGPESEYPEWIAKGMDALWSKLREDGTVLINLSAQIKDGELSDSVYRTILAIRDRRYPDGGRWIQNGEPIWYKPEASPLGSNKEPRRAYEHILRFGKISRPYVDAKACGTFSLRVGLESNDPHGQIDGTNTAQAGIARTTDVIFANGGADTPEAIDHPWVYPPKLVYPLILTHSRGARSLIADPFCGSGTTCLVAQGLDCDFIGIDIEQEFVDLAKHRLETDPEFARGVLLKKWKLERAEIERKVAESQTTSKPVKMPKQKPRKRKP